MVSGEDVEAGLEGSSEEIMGPPGQAGTSEEGRQGERPDDVEGDDGVSSEGEKQPAREEGEEEGREAEASQSPNESRQGRGSGPSARRSMRLGLSRSSRQGPTPIVWGDQRQSMHRQQPYGRGRGGPMGFGTRAVARRNRSRMRPFGGRFY